MFFKFLKLMFNAYINGYKNFVFKILIPYIRITVKVIKYLIENH